MKTLSIIKYSFTLVGVGLLVGALLLFKSTSSFIDQATSAEGTVVDLVASRSSNSTTYRPVVRFLSQSGQNVEFTSSTGSSPASYSTGEKVEVLYLASDPQGAQISGFFDLWGGSVILAGLGSVFFLVGGGIILFGVLHGRKEAFLRQQGMPIETQFQGVEINESLTVNGQNPFRVVTQWLNPETTEVHVFRSNNLWFDPVSYINGSKVIVFIERGNPSKYHVDLSFLPKVATGSEP
ncbi:MAG: DUF3592 domain-containing protein [Pseudomonadota bacterium]